MDPNETLETLRYLVAHFNYHHDSDHPQRQLVDAVVDLDEWLTAGGFPPDEWVKKW